MHLIELLLLQHICVCAHNQKTFPILEVQIGTIYGTILQVLACVCKSNVIRLFYGKHSQSVQTLAWHVIYVHLLSWI